MDRFAENYGSCEGHSPFVACAGLCARLKFPAQMDETGCMADLPAATGAVHDERFRVLVEDLPAITYIADFDEAFTLRYVSPQIAAVLGFSAQDWIADPDAWVDALHPDDRERIVAEARGVHRRGAPVRLRVPHAHQRRARALALGEDVDRP